MKIAVFSCRSYDKHFLQEALQNAPASMGFEFLFFETALDNHTASLAQGCQAVCVFVNDHLDQPVLEALHALGVRAVLLRCVGFNNVDLITAEKLGFFVAPVPAYSPETVAEHALALVMTLSRKTHRAYNRVREGNFALEGLVGNTIHGKTVGIIGTGKIGLATARIFHGMGCNILGCDPVPSLSFAPLGQMVPLEALLAQSDIVSLHCPANESNYRIINAKSLALMKAGSMLVNTSRGTLVDTRAVIKALKSRHLGYLAIDVYEQEGALFFQNRSGEIISDDVFERLLTFPNVLVTGHQGFLTTEALREISEATLQNLCHFAAGTDSPNKLRLP